MAQSLNIRPPLSRITLIGVIAAHAGLLAVLWQMTTLQKIQAPIVLSVSMIDPAPEPEPKPVPETTPTPSPVKPVVQPPRLASQSAPKPNETTVAVTQKESVPVPVSAQEDSIPSVHQSAQSVPAQAGVTIPASAAPSPPRFDAAYLDNPKPSYPLISRRMKEEGRVLLRVQVSANGQAADVEVHTSSGSMRLDQSALETVRRWKFVPARQGSEAVAASVLVPIVFSLKE